MAYERIGVSGLDFTRTNYNLNIDSLESIGVYQLGRGVVSGLTLSASGLALSCTSGVVNALSCQTVTSVTGVTMPDNSTRYVWLTTSTTAGVTTGTLSLSSTTADPGGNAVCLGRAVSASGVVTLTTYGRVDVMRWTDVRTQKLGQNLLVCDHLNQWVGFGKVPAAAFDFNDTITSAGSGVFSGSVSGTSFSASQHQPDPVNTETLTATKTLVLTDKNIQALTASGASRDCKLPASTSLTYGHWFRIMNVGSSNNIVVKDNSGATTLCTLTPGQYCDIRPTVDAGSPDWPNSATATGLGTPL